VLFTALKTLTNIILRVFDLVNQTVYPEFSMAWGKNDVLLLKKLHRMSCQASFWIGAIAIAGLAMLGRWIFAIWIGEEVEFDYLILLGLLLVMGLRSLWYTSFVLPASINKHQKIAIIYLVSSLLGLSLFVVLLKVQDIHWAFLGLFFVEIVMILTVVLFSIRLSRDSIYDFLSTIVRPPDIVKLVRFLKKKGEVL